MWEVKSIAITILPNLERIISKAEGRRRDRRRGARKSKSNEDYRGGGSNL